MFGLRLGELVIVALVLVMVAAPILLLLFLLTWARTLRLTRAHQTTSPGFVWLMLVPIFNLGWQFFLLRSATRGIKGRLAELGRDAGDGGFGLGVAYQSLLCLFAPLSLLPVSYPRSPLVGMLFVAAVAIWIGYWVRISRFNRVMATAASEALRAAAVF